MSTRHFNQLLEDEAERLAILIEECGEVTQAACKILRHGYESTNPKAHTPADQDPETNREGLQRELGDLLHALNRLTTAGDLNRRDIDVRAASKPERILPYLHHQVEPTLAARPTEPAE